MTSFRQKMRSHWQMGAVALALSAVIAGVALRPGEAGAARDPLPVTLSQQLTVGAQDARAQLPDGRWLVLERDGSSLSLRTDDSSSREVRRWSLPAVRRLASVSLLPSGRVLVWGGVDAQGQPQANGVWFDPATQTLSPALSLGLVSRAGHAATVLSDGRLLLTGGWSPGVAGVTQSELWDERSGTVSVVTGSWQPPRLGHASVLGADGRVRLSGGVDAQGRRFTADQQFDPEQQAFSAAPVLASKRPPQSPVVSASVPASKAQAVSPDVRLSLRFSEPLQASELNTTSVVLFGPGGRTAVQVVPAESGRLLFVTPRQALFPDSAYTLLIDGVRGRNGQPLAATAIDFKTAALGSSTDATSASTSGEDTPVQITGEGARSSCPQKGASFSPCRARSELKDGVWYPGVDNTDSRWRIYTPDQRSTPNASMAKTAALYGVTAVRGRVVRVDEQPVANVEVSIGQQTARTNADGWFTLLDAPVGQQELYVDGSTANTKAAEYGQFVVGVRVAKGQLNELNYLLHLPRITARDKIQIASPLKQELRVGHPDMPGLELRIPAGTVIRDRKGRLVTELAIVPTPVNRFPFPVMENHPMAFTVEPGGAQVQGLTQTASGGIRVYYPNYDRKAAGTVADFWIYDPREGWRVYGQGAVSADGRQFVPERGVALHQTMGGMFSVPDKDPAARPGQPADQHGNCCGGGAENSNAKEGGVGRAGDPVDLRTGDFVYSDTDVVISDTLPLAVSRTYRPRDMVRREFGYGTALGYNYYLQRSSDDYAYIKIVLPNGSPVTFDRVSGAGAQGVWRQNGSRTQFAGAVMRSVFDDDPELSYGRAYRVTLRDGSSMQFGSYTDNRLQWIADRFGNRIRLVYNAGLLSQLVSPNGRTVSFEYDTQNRIQFVRDHTGRAWKYQYDANGLLERVTYPDQTFKTYTYVVAGLLDDLQCKDDWRIDGPYCLYVSDMRRLGNPMVQHVMESVTDRRRHRVVFNEHPKVGSWIGRIAKQTLADNGVYQFDYSWKTPENRLQVVVTSPDSTKRRVEFEQNSLYPLNDTFGYGTDKAQTYSFLRYSSGQVRERTDPLGRKTTYSYNSAGQITQLTELAGTPKARTTSWTYNSIGLLETVTDPLKRVTKLEYIDGCLSKITDPLQRSTDILCNVAGQPLTVTDAKGYTTTFRYEGGELTAVVDPMGRAVGMAYDTLGRLIVVRDTQGRISRREYDSNDRVWKSTDPLRQETTLSYDNNGNVDAVMLPHNNGITYVYDERDRVKERRDSLDQTQYWTYYLGDQIKTYKDRKGQTTTFTYDALQRPDVTTLHDGSTQTYRYDEVDRLRSLTDSATGVVSWDYDDFDRMYKETGANGAVTYDYDDADRRIGMTAGSQAKVEYRYDDANQLKRLWQGSEVVEYDYDEIGRRKTMTLPNGVTAAYTFNDGSDLTGLAYAKTDGTVLGTLGYGYDNVGRRTAQTGTFANNLLPTASTGNEFDDNHRQTKYRGQTLTYDTNGNLESDGTRTYVWNTRDQLVAIRQGAQTIASFEYDPLGRRTAKAEGGQSVRYLYDGLDAVEETRGTAVTGILTGQGIDERYARTDASGRTYFLTDALGSTKALTNSAGAVVQRYDYTPYGQTQATQTSFNNPYQYTGRELDQSGLYYYRARYYHPGMARFISEDPIGLAGGINTYAYVGGSPLFWVDPYGLSGTLTIYASGVHDGSSGSGGMSGHAWISYTPDGGVETTYGTWGNNPFGLGNGLHTNLEKGRPSDVSRRTRLDDKHEAEFMKVIESYEAQGDDAWGFLSPCSSFASEAWNSATGESLSPYGPYSNPSSLIRSIIAANRGLKHGVR